MAARHDHVFTATARTRREEGLAVSWHDLQAAIIEGAVARVRPKMMTVSAIMAGLLPILWSTGTGAKVMRRSAVPMVGGMVSSTILTLLVIPAIYAIAKGVAAAVLSLCHGKAADAERGRVNEKRF